MKLTKISTLFLALFFLGGCAHLIPINPPLESIRNSAPAEKSQLIVGYYISPEDKNKQVTTPGGGGDKVSYYPYKDTEGALNAVLSNLYTNVFPVPSVSDKEFASSKNISLIFVPKLSTKSSSSSALTWPPTHFEMTITCSAFDQAGNEVWKTEVTGIGNAEFKEFKSDFPLAARRATEDAFKKLQSNLLTSKNITTGKQ